MMLKGVCLGILSLAVLPFSSQSPLQGDKRLEQRQASTASVTVVVHGTGIVTPVTALTSTQPTTKPTSTKSNLPRQRPITALTSRITVVTSTQTSTSSNFARQVTPVTALTSTQSLARSILERQATYLAVPMGTSKPIPSLANPPTPTAVSPVPTKTGLRNCNVQGIASDDLSSDTLGGKRARDVLECQRSCMYISRCESYSFQKTIEKDAKNCQFYTTLIDGRQKVELSSTSGTFFSDKYPADGSNFCYGSSEL